MKSLCLDAVEDLELASLTKFAWVVYVRVDMDLLGHHPPLAPMALRGGIWIPEGQDFGGLNDRWAVVHRHHLHTYFKRWEAFLDGSALSYFNDLLVGFPEATRLNPEQGLLLHLHYH